VIVRKSAREVAQMRAAGDVVAETLELLSERIRPGVTTADLDRAADDHIRSRGGEPTFKGYRGYPAAICTSPNEVIVHGIPGGYALDEGDVLSVDVGVTLGGFVADSAATFPVGPIAPEAHRLLETCRTALAAGIDQARAGNRVGDISAAVQAVVEAAGFTVVRILVGHGVGRSMHEDPQIPNFGSPGRGALLAPGMTLAIEPMITAGAAEIVLDEDGWTISTADGSLAAHCEHTVAVSEHGPPAILTLGRAREAVAGDAARAEAGLLQ
jgi:methionyl aminopeptidase